MAMKTSSFKVWSQRSCSTVVGRTTSVGLFCFSKRTYTLLDTRHYCGTNSLDSLSKRRSRGPVMAAKKAAEGKKQEDGKYKHTIDLPTTAFGMRANAVVREPEIQKLWEDNQVFKRVVEKNNGGTFVLHDGPPYANGDLHIGHALNKILKDIINRYKLLQNYKVRYVPGWDCHGLPIELKVLQSMDSDVRKELTPIKLRKKAAKFAKDTVNNQMKSFKRYAVWGDWENPYLTLSPDYEAAQIEVFSQMAIRGHIYRGRKPVHWSPSSRTALAEAELEYPEGHISKSIYAIFKLASFPPAANELFEEFFPNLFLSIWTTTPWTVPANAAVAVNAKLQYAVIEVHALSEDLSPLENGQRTIGSVLKSDHKKPLLVVASDLVPTLESKWGVKVTVKKTFMGSELENCRYIHPIDGRECPVVIGGDYITTESGTGLVHTAPGHGQEDYVTGLKYGLPVFSPVDDDGKFTEEAGIFSGKDVLKEGNMAVVEHLDKSMSLLMEESYKHKYPHDWRTKKPTIFRATEQWFASVEGFRQDAMNAIGHVAWVPPQAQNRISAMTSSRSDWCISRQRTWGVPIPVFYNVHSKEPLINEETVDHIKAIISQKGSDAWWYMTVEELLPEKYRSKASEYQKGTDTMDVWFDSGSSWAAVLEKRDGLNYPADLYLEGSDQHRGWFQSSLLTSIATKGKAPYARVITHGFVLDERGHKMSKSLGNVVDPNTVIEGGKNTKDAPSYGADVLRLWVSSVDYTNDVLIGPQILRQMSDMYRKLRGTLRYLLSNLHDWKPENAVSYDDLPMIDQYALYQLENHSHCTQKNNMATNTNATLPVPSPLQHVQELSVNGVEPPPKFIRKDLDEEAPLSHSLSGSIPIINVSLLSSPSSSSKEKERELAKLKLALTQWGFFQAVDHGVPTVLLGEVQSIGKEFFDLPMQEKCKSSNILEGKHEFLQGYGNDIAPSEDEICEWADRLNLVVKPFDQRNYKFWPANPTRFRDIIDEYSMNLHLVAEIILKNMAISLGVKEDFFISPIKEKAPASIMFNFYPPCLKPDLVYGIKPHTDSGAITILLQDKEVEGLQILKGGQWVKVPIIPNALLVNIGDQVEIMCNGVFKSVMHRVIPNSEKQRISVGMFFAIEKENSLEPAIELITETTPKMFKTMTSAEYGEIYVQRISEGLNTIDGARV